MKTNNAIWLTILLFVVINSWAGNKPLTITAGLYASYSPYCAITNDLKMYYQNQSDQYYNEYFLHSKINTKDVGGFLDLKYFRFSFYRTRSVTYTGTAPGAFQETFEKSTFYSYTELNENGGLINNSEYHNEYVPVNYQAMNYAFCFKYPFYDIVFPFAGLGFSNIKRMDLDGNGADDFTYGVPAQRIGIYGVDTIGSVSGRNKSIAFATVGVGLMKRLGDFSIELLWQADFGIDGKNPYTRAYKDYQEAVYSTTAQNPELTAKPTSYYKMSVGLTFGYTFSLDTKMKSAKKSNDAPPPSSSEL
jgi:hypothetical protein